MPPGLSHKDGRIFIELVSHTFPDKEAHKRIIYEYILKLEITESNNMESFTREIRRHINNMMQSQEANGRKSPTISSGNTRKLTPNHSIQDLT
jgi:hypothetical protein